MYQFDYRYIKININFKINIQYVAHSGNNFLVIDYSIKTSRYLNCGDRNYDDEANVYMDWATR